MAITLALIVRNEQYNLYDCIKSFIGTYDQLLIVDTGSTDQTKQIGVELGAKVIDFEWIDNFSAARNFALRNVETEWVFMVDSDDRLQEGKAQIIKSTIEKANQNNMGYLLPYVYSSVNGENGVKAYIARIWRTHADIQYVLPVHEYLDIPDTFKSKFERLDTPIIHTKPQEKYLQSSERNLAIMEKVLVNGTAHPRIFFYLGQDNQNLGRFEKAAAAYKQFVAYADNADERSRAACNGGHCLLQLKKIDEAVTEFMRAIELSDKFIEPFLYLGDIELFKQNHEKAVEYYFYAASIKPPITHLFVNMHLYNGLAKQKIRQVLEKLEPKK